MGPSNTWRFIRVLLLIVGAGFLATVSAAGKSRRKLTAVDPLQPNTGGNYNASQMPFAGSSIKPMYEKCKGVQIDYMQLDLAMIPPVVDPSNPANKSQPYKFYAQLYVSNIGYKDLKGWQIQVGWYNREILVYMGGAILRSTATLPSPVDASSIIMGYPLTDLQNSYDTSGNWSLIQTRIEIYGTAFGTSTAQSAMPLNLTLLNKGYTYDPTLTPLDSNKQRLTACYQEIQGYNETSALEQELVPQSITNSSSDIVIIWDVTASLVDNYDAHIMMHNRMKYGRINNWTLSWEWTGGEVIQKMFGAEATIVGNCLRTTAAIFYPNLQNSVHTCEETPQIIDWTTNRAVPDNPNLKHCCTNGSIQPAIIDPSLAMGEFIMTVLKVPPLVGQDVIVVPRNFRVNGDEYICQPAYRVMPTVIPIPGTRRINYAVQSFEIECNKTANAQPQCCVSFSAYWNDTAAPCKACACGCTYKNTIPGTCNASGLPTPLPWEALILPAVNRTEAIIKYEHMHRRTLLPAKKLPACEDHCGISLNWHIKGSSFDGWASRLTIFNWRPDPVVDWFVAIEHPFFGALSQAFSANYTWDADNSNWVLFTGIEHYNQWLLGMNSSLDPAVPGTIQAVVAFNKNASTPKLDFNKGQGFPSRVIFNGMECALPSYYPQGSEGGPPMRMRSSSSSCWWMTAQAIFVALVLANFL